MSTYEHRPVNPNRSGITRSGNVSGFTATYRHPSDRRLDYALLIAIAVAVVCIGLGVTAWADVPFGGAA
jgi:hypothetical protein